MGEAGGMLGRFELEAELGRGAMGVVWRAIDPLIGRPVAIKTIDAEHFAFEPEARERFLREARAAGRLNHPNIVTIFDAGSAGEDTYIVMELIAGRTLSDMLAGGERLPPFAVADIGAQIAEALDYAHAHGVVHRDIKPANIMITASGRVKITDFGVARLEDAARTRVGTVHGSPRYMSPEQLMGRQVDGRSDIFSLGVLLYQLVTGVCPFGASGSGNLMELIKEIMHAEPVRPGELNRTAPKAFDAIIARAMRKDPAERYARAADVVNDLRNYKALTRSLDPDETVTLVVRAGEASPAEPAARDGQAAAASATEGGDPAGGEGLLADLRRRVAERSARTATVPPDTDAAREVDARMRAALTWLQEFARCAGILKPAIRREYAFVTETFRNLAVIEAFTGCETVGEADRELLASITLTVNCLAPQQYRFERDAKAVKPFTDYLNECGLHYSLARVRSDQREMTAAVFRVLGEIRIEVRLVADHAASRVRIDGRNLERFGVSAFTVPAHALDRALLDELGWLLLGRPSQFGVLAEREAGGLAG